MKTHPPLNALSLACASLLWTASAAAQCGDQQSVTVDGTHNPFLAGQANGVTSKGDIAPTHSPFALPVALSEGKVLHFSSVVGNVHHSGQGPAPGPEGDTAVIVTMTPDLGISGGALPRDSLLGVFLGDVPNPGVAPGALDFSTAAARDYDVLLPELHQVFYIGDGLRQNGFQQSVMAPTGASRLFLGSADGAGWSDNVGAFDLDVLVDTDPVRAYCSSKLSANGCLPAIGWSGTPDTVGTKDFLVTCSNVMPNRFGFVFYGYSNNALPFQGGTLCVWQGLKRMRSKTSAGTGTCQATFTMDFDAYIRTGADPNLVPGAEIYAQWWWRDPQSPSKTGLSDALHIAVCQ